MKRLQKYMLSQALLLWVLLSFAYPSSGQQSTDELYQRILKQTDITEKFALYDTLLDLIIGSGDTILFKKYLEAYKIDAQKSGIKKYISKYDYTADIWRFYHNQNFSEAIPLAESYLENFTRSGNKPMMMIVMRDLIYLNFERSKFDEALKLAIKLLKLSLAEKDTPTITFAYNEMARIFDLNGDSIKALQYYRMSYQIMAIFGKNLVGLAALSNNIGLGFKHTNPDSAAGYYHKSIDYFNAAGIHNQISRPYGNLGWLYLQQQKFDSALYYYHKSWHYEDSGGIKTPYSAEPLTGLASVFIAMGQTDSALHYAAKALAILEALPFKSRQLVEIYYLHSDLFVKTGKYQEAYDYLVLAADLNDTLFTVENANAVKEMEAGFQSEQKQLEIDEQKARLQQQKNVNYASAALASTLLLLSAGVWYRLRRKKRLGRELSMARDRAEKSEKFKQQFLANMSHEIRTPMNAVMGMNMLLLDQEPRANQLRYLNGIRKASGNLLHIINDILDISKIQAGKVDLENIDFSLRDITAQVMEILMHKATEKGLILLMDLDERLPDVRTGDPVRLTQVLMNLAGNAIKFTDRGTVTLKIASDGDPRYAIFSVSDTGIGIPADKLDSIFESFAQAAASDTRLYGGTGLGLTISRQLVELMGGQLKVESETGKGSTFSFTLHLPEGSADRLDNALTGKEIDATALNGLRLLLVDDNEYNRMVARDSLLSKADLHINEASNGKEAFEKMKTHPFDIVLMDIQMPVMDGYEATKHIRNELNFPAKNTPIIALTASVLRSDLEQCTKAGMNDYVLKPFQLSTLLNAIARHTGRELRTVEVIITEQKSEPMPAASGDRVTDLTYLRKFCENDRERIGRYLQIFLNSAPEVIEKIRLAMENEDYGEIASQTHGFKTKLAMMGMVEGKDLATRLEIACRRPDPDKKSIVPMTTAFANMLETAVGELSALTD